MTQLVSHREQVASVRSLLERAKPQIALALPKHLTADRLIRVALTSVQRTPELLQCDQTSLLAAIIQSAQLGLEPDGVLGQAYLIPFNNTKKGKKEVQFIAGYKGLCALARRSGEISSIDARVVREGDKFKYTFGLNPVLEHVPGETAEDEPEGAITHAYAVIRLKDGGHQFDVMTRGQIDAIRKRSRAGTSGPWVTDYAEMAKKTVLRRVLKLAPMSVEAQRAVALDELAEAGIPQELTLDQVDTTTGEMVEASPPAPSKLQQLAESLPEPEPAGVKA